MKLVKSLMVVDLLIRVAEIRVSIVEVMLRNMIPIATPPWTILSQGVAPHTGCGGGTAVIVATAVALHWRIGTKIYTVNIEVSAPWGNPTVLRG